MQKFFDLKINMRNPEKAERERIIEWIIENDEKLQGLEVSVPEIAKYLQGKSIKEIKNILIKVLGGRENQGEVIKKLS
jgi:hypothetical protein